MMNNFDMSSKGEAIEVSVFYDQDLSSIYYKEFEQENTRLSFGRDSSLFLLGNVDAPAYSKTELNKMRKCALVALDDFHELLCPYDYSDYTRAELIAELKKVTIKMYYERLVKMYTWHEIKNHFEHDFYISHGYSQGDAAYIISVDEALTPALREHVNHILWDCPISYYLTVNGESVDELMESSGEYEYDVDALRDGVKKYEGLSEYAKTWICDNLPAVPKYY
jgi:hypothetical protein